MNSTLEDYKKQIDGLSLPDLYDIYEHIDKDRHKDKFEYIKSKIAEMQKEIVNEDKPKNNSNPMWKEVKSKRLVFYLSHLSWVVTSISLAILFPRGIINGMVTAIFNTCWIGIYCFVVRYLFNNLYKIKCPNCREYLFRSQTNLMGKKEIKNPFSKQCLNCGIKIEYK